MGGDLLSSTAHRRGLIAVRGEVEAGKITRVPLREGDVRSPDAGGGDAGVPQTHVADGAVLDSGLLDSGLQDTPDAGPTDAGMSDAGLSPIDASLPGPTELCTPDVGCAADEACWYIAGEGEYRCVIPCETVVDCPAVYGSDPQCTVPGCQTSTTVCLPEPWRGCF